MTLTPSRPSSTTTTTTTTTTTNDAAAAAAAEQDPYTAQNTKDDVNVKQKCDELAQIVKQIKVRFPPPPRLPLPGRRSSSSASRPSSSAALTQPPLLAGDGNQNQVAMMTTRAPDSDELHSRAMYPASTDSLQFVFFGNCNSGKFEGIEKDKVRGESAAPAPEPIVGPALTTPH